MCDKQCKKTSWVLPLVQKAISPIIRGELGLMGGRSLKKTPTGGGKDQIIVPWRRKENKGKHLEEGSARLGTKDGKLVKKNRVGMEKNHES